VRIQVIASMAELGDAEAVDRLIQYSQGDAVMRIVALQTMVDLAEPRTREALLYRLSLPDEHIQHRLIEARALGRLGGPGGRDGGHEGYDLALRSLTFAPRDASAELSEAERAEEAVRVRALAALTLGDIGDARALPTLESLAAGAEDPRVQLAASVAICHIVKPALSGGGRR
jgi:HEAT repeat protein